MSYLYTNGDGYQVLLPVEPADTDPVAVVGQALRQIKAFLNDPQATFGGKYCFNAAVAANQNIVANGAANHINFPTEYFDLNGDFNTGTGKFTAAVNGIYEFEFFGFFNLGSAVAATLRMQAWVGKNGLSLDQLGDYTAVYNTNYNAWRLAFTNKIIMNAGDTAEVVVSGQDSVGTGNFSLTVGRFEGLLLSRF